MSRILEHTLTHVNFEEPTPFWHDVTIVAATFWQAGDDTHPTGRIYTDGSCSCGNYQAHGRCLHTNAWQTQQEQMAAMFESADYEQTLELASYRTQ